MIHNIWTWLLAAGYLGVPHWGLVSFFALGAIEYTLPRLKNPRARSLGELAANGMGLLLGRFPLLGPLAKKAALFLGTPQAGDATAKPDEPNAVKP